MTAVALLDFMLTQAQDAIARAKIYRVEMMLLAADDSRREIYTSAILDFLLHATRLSTFVRVLTR